MAQLPEPLSVSAVQHLPRHDFYGRCGCASTGVASGIVAVMTRHEIVLFIMGGIFVLETVSVIIQVGFV